MKLKTFFLLGKWSAVTCSILQSVVNELNNAEPKSELTFRWFGVFLLSYRWTGSRWRRLPAGSGILLGKKHRPPSLLLCVPVFEPGVGSVHGNFILFGFRLGGLRLGISMPSLLMCAPPSVWGFICWLSVFIPSFSPFYIFISAVCPTGAFSSSLLPSVFTSIFEAVVCSREAVCAGIPVMVLPLGASVLGLACRRPMPFSSVLGFFSAPRLLRTLSPFVRRLSVRPLHHEAGRGGERMPATAKVTPADAPRV